MFGLFKKVQAGERFALESGERQTEKSLADIRLDSQSPI